jgi:hypothetical protein
MKLNSLAILSAVRCQASNPLWTRSTIWVTMAAPEISPVMLAAPSLLAKDWQSDATPGNRAKAAPTGRAGKKMSRSAERT